MSHPQLLAHLLGRPLPPQPGELGTPHVPAVPATVEPHPGHHAAEACRLLHVGRWTVRCAVHGLVWVDECSYPAACPHEGSR